MLDALVVGAGPAGAVAAIVLARAGARVLMIDRAHFPRPKLCGDTLNPGTVAMLRRLGLSDAVECAGLPVHGMRVTGEGGVSIEGRYPPPLVGRALSRRDFDWGLVRQAMAAGAVFESGVTVRAPYVIGPGRGVTVGGVWAGGPRKASAIRARVTIAADGRRSVLTFALGLAAHPRRPRRWAIGGLVEGLTEVTTLGEMHVRRNRYIGVSPQPDGLANVCLVVPHDAVPTADRSMRDPGALLARIVQSDPVLAARSSAARLVDRPAVLGPLAVDVYGVAPHGLLIAGDAAGFVDPMTGDGLRFAIRGGELAAQAALEALTAGWAGVHARLARRRQAEFGPKWRFNRLLRTLVASPPMVSVAAAGASLAPGVVRALVRRAGDCDLAWAHT